MDKFTSKKQTLNDSNKHHILNRKCFRKCLRRILIKLLSFSNIVKNNNYELYRELSRFIVTFCHQVNPELGLLTLIFTPKIGHNITAI